MDGYIYVDKTDLIYSLVTNIFTCNKRENILSQPPETIWEKPSAIYAGKLFSG